MAGRTGRDTLAARAGTPQPDTIKPPLSRPYTPRSTEVGSNGWHWTRDAMFATGALTLGELLAQVPGVTSITTGFILAPRVAAWYGDPGRVRIFLDGVEYDAINFRNGGVHDLAATPLWSLEDVDVERAPGELRVHLRTWRVERTTPSTRTDVLTGSENLNLYRGFFGRRYRNGASFQVAGQQLSTISRGGMDGDALGLMARAGWANESWSIDGTFLRQAENRSSGFRFITTNPVAGAVPGLKGVESIAYFRVAWRDPQRDGPWAQVIASSRTSGINSRRTPGTGSTPSAGLNAGTAADSVDSTAFRAQYVAAAGITWRGVRLSGTNSLRVFNGRSYLSPGARAEYDAKRITAAVFAERGADSTTRSDVFVRIAPVAWMSVGAAASRAAPDDPLFGAPTTTSRIELGVRFRDRWLTGGVVNRSASTVVAPVELDSTLRAVAVSKSTGAIASLRGPLWLGWTIATDLIAWDAGGPYRPQTEARTRLGFESSFARRFPRGNFHLAVSATHEYRSIAYAPSATSIVGQSMPAFSAISTLLEIRIGSAIISWGYRNALGAIYQTYPGYVMPRLVNVYGVRWEFWN